MHAIWSHSCVARTRAWIVQQTWCLSVVDGRNCIWRLFFFSWYWVHSSHHKSKPFIRNIEKYIFNTWLWLILLLLKKVTVGGCSAHGASNAPQSCCLFVFFFCGTASVSQLFLHWPLHAEQLTEEDFPLPLYDAVWRCSYQGLSPEVAGLLSALCAGPRRVIAELCAGGSRSSTASPWCFGEGSQAPSPWRNSSWEYTAFGDRLPRYRRLLTDLRGWEERES